MGAHGLRPGRHHRHGLSAALHFVTVNARELRYLLARAPRAGATLLTLALFVLFTLTG